MNQHNKSHVRLFLLISMIIMMSSLYVWTSPSHHNQSSDNSVAQSLVGTKEAGHASSKENAKIASSTDSASASSLDQSMLSQPFDPHDMSLMGIHLDDSTEDLTSSWGEPSSSYIMPEEEPVKVYEYDGFSVGCTASGHVAFVEVHQSGLHTGIDGLRVGEHSDTVKKAMGSPDQDSGYVWGYSTSHSMLRLDLDPTTSKVHAVKLFRTTAA